MGHRRDYGSLMVDQLEADLETEETRLRSAYSRRPQSSRYSWFNEAHVFLAQELERDILTLLQSIDFKHLQDKKILDVGCGSGPWLSQVIKWGARPENVKGIDVLQHRVSQARQLCPAGMQIHCGNAMRLPFNNESFDLVVQFGVFSSILDLTVKEMIAREMLRVLKEKGFVVWYDFFVNNPSNSDVQGIRKREITQLFPGCRIDVHRVSLAPPLCRWLARYTWLGCYLLERMQVFNTHYLALITRN